MLKGCPSLMWFWCWSPKKMANIAVSPQSPIVPIVLVDDKNNEYNWALWYHSIVCPLSGDKHHDLMGHDTILLYNVWYFNRVLKITQNLCKSFYLKNLEIGLKFWLRCLKSLNYVSTMIFGKIFKDIIAFVFLFFYPRLVLVNLGVLLAFPDQVAESWKRADMILKCL